MATMEKHKKKSKQSRRKEQAAVEDVENVPDPPKLEDFQCGPDSIQIEIENASAEDSARQDDFWTSAENKNEKQEEIAPVHRPKENTACSTSFSSEFSMRWSDIVESDNQSETPGEASTHIVSAVIESPRVELGEGAMIGENVETELKEIGQLSSQVEELKCSEVDTKLCSPKHKPKVQTKVDAKVFDAACDILSEHQESYIEPTAPVIESVIQRNMLDQTETSSAEVVAGQKMNIQDIVKASEPVIDCDIKPFSESQLLSLYVNNELECNSEFIAQFIDGQKSLQKHELYELLMNYLRVRNRLISNIKDVDNFKKDYKELQQLLWTTETMMVSDEGECQDGNPVAASHEYQVSKFNESSLVIVNRTLNNIKDLVHQVHSLNSYSSEVHRLQIENYIQNVVNSCPDLHSLPHNAPVSGSLQYPSGRIAMCMDNFKSCISILFMFQRKSIKDRQFVVDTREWLGRLVSILLRIGTFQDHLFVLNHVLRSPAGVGSWGSEFVQIPLPVVERGSSTFGNPCLDHLLTVLATLLLPVRERESFLEHIHAAMQENMSGEDSVWVLVDSDGEEDDDIEGSWSRFKENDLVSLLNQIPMDALFRHVLMIDYRDDTDIYDISRVSEHNMLKLFAFSTIFVKLLKEGLKTYNNPRYKQFAKRLGRLIRHTVQYVSDHWENYRTSYIASDPAMLKRLQIEYDNFFMRATKCIFSSQKLGAWQYLAVIPYNVVSTSMLWRLFYVLHEDYQEEDTFASGSYQQQDCEKEITDSYSRQAFEEKITTIPDAESYYLLTAFANMAMARGEADRGFIKAATLDLFQVGYISSGTQELCSKPARILLSNVMSKHPSLISDVLFRLKKKFQSVGMLSLYLFKELPLNLWSPTTKDMEILSEWLMNCPLMSTESLLARHILNNLNWGFDEGGRTLFLQHNLHRHVALIVVEACLKFIPEKQYSGVINEGVKQVSNLASIVRHQTPEQAFNSWAWVMVTKLRLHLLDQADHSMRAAITNQQMAFHNVPDVETDPRLEILRQGVKDKHPIACFVSVLMTTWGHSVPLICSKGFCQLNVLLYHHRYESILQVLHHVIPLFIECSESLVTSDRFLSIIISLVTADRSYVKMAKNLIAPEFPGPVIKMFGSMIESQLENTHRYCLLSPAPLVMLWMSCFCRIPEWTKELGVLYLMDILFRSSFFHSDAKDAVSNKLQELFNQTMEEMEKESPAAVRQGGAITSFINWMATGTVPLSSLMCRSSCPECPWFAYFILEVEEEEIEEKTGLWTQVLKELRAGDRISVDQAVKRAASIVKVSPPNSGTLSIYRWSQQALDMPLDHPLLPLVWQKFFMLFLARVSSTSGVEMHWPSLRKLSQTQHVQDHGSVGDKFFEGMINLGFLKKVKKKLQDAKEYYGTKSCDNADNLIEDYTGRNNDISEEKRQWYKKCSRIFRTFSLWLEEPRLLEANLYLPALPPQYDSDKLALILQGNKNPWLEYLDFEGVRESQKSSSRNWETQHFRSSEQNAKKAIPMTEEEKQSPTVRILRRLKSYDHPVPAPPLRFMKPVVPIIQRDMLVNKGSMLNGLRSSFKAILEYAQIYSLRTSEHTALDCNFSELVPNLYKNVETEVLFHAACDTDTPSNKSNPTCAGPAPVVLKFCESRINEGVEHQIQQNRSEYETLLNRSLAPPPQKVCSSSVFIENVVSILANEHQQCKFGGDVEFIAHLQEVGVTLFYHMTTLFNDDTLYYPPTKQLLTSCIEILGQLFICGEESQCLKLLTTIIQHPQLGGLLAPHFTPTSANTVVFLQMYHTIVDISQQDPDLIFVLLSKFDVSKWLMKHRPKLSERSKFIDLVGKALSVCGLVPEDSQLVLHEVYRNHLKVVLMYDFPEHYGEILNMLLRGSESQSIALDVWFDVFNALGCDKLKLKQGQNLGKIKDEIRKYATEQKLLTHQEIWETAHLLATYFMKERLEYGLYGLYPKYRSYVEPFTVLFGMVGHALVVSTLQLDKGTLSDKLSEKLWPPLSEMFSPWLAPYWAKQVKEQSADWIQQLTDDRAAVLPWIPGDGGHANRMVVMFVECIRFLLDTLPACSNILCFVWQYYASGFANSAVKDHILNVIHGSFLTLPWDRFWPTIPDLELMLKVIDQYLPDCHSFLGGIFIEVPWCNWIAYVTSAFPPQVAIRTHVCILHLLVKLSTEPTVRQTNKIAPLLLDAQKFSWHLIDGAAFEQIVNWYVMSCDPRVVLEMEERNQIDIVALELLQVVAAYTPSASHFHVETLRKRQIFVRACVKLLLSSAGRYKSLFAKKEVAFHIAVRKLLDDVEVVTITTVPQQQQVAESALLLGEILSLVNQPATNPLSRISVESIVRWLNSHDSTSVVLQGVLRITGTMVQSSESLGSILEAALQSFFKDTVPPLPPPDWNRATSTLQPAVPRQPPIEETLVNKGHFLTLYALLLRRLKTCRDISEEGSVLENLTDWMISVKPIEATESKLPLLWGKILCLSLRQCLFSGDIKLVVKLLQKFSQSLITLSEDRSGWGILGAIGLGKQSAVSTRCRLLSRALAAYILAQLPGGDGVRIHADAPGAVASSKSSTRPSSPEAGEDVPTADALKALQLLEGLLNNKQYLDLRGVVEQAVKVVRDANNSLHNAEHVLGLLSMELYHDRYLSVLKV